MEEEMCRYMGGDTLSDQRLAIIGRLATQIAVYHTKRLAICVGSCWAPLLYAKIAECIIPGN